MRMSGKHPMKQVQANPGNATGSEIVVVVDLKDDRLTPRYELGGGVEALVAPEAAGRSLTLEDEKRLLASILDNLTFGRKTQMSHKVGTTDGKWRNLESEGTIVRDADGKPSKIRAIIRDVTLP